MAKLTKIILLFVLIVLCSMLPDSIPAMEHKKIV
jgi:hypothetical protein